MSNPYLIKRSIQLSGHRTSIALEQEFWDILNDVATKQQKSLTAIISEIDASRQPDHPLSSILRLTVLHFLLQRK